MSSTPSGIRTFLIADVRGYTSFTQRHGDAAAGRLASAFAEIAQEGVEAWGGTLVELRGDEALCVFASARHALRAAVELADAFREATDDDPSLPLRVGFGLDAGEAVPVAGGYRGGALNLAARLCSKAGPGEVLASESVIHLARTVDDLAYTSTEPFEMKGIDEPVQAFHVEASPATATPASTIGPSAVVELPAELDLVSPFVGRQDELRWLRWGWRRARHGHGRAGFVIGGVGMGRTRLTAELARTVNADGAPVLYINGTNDGDVTTSIDPVADLRGPALVVVDDLTHAADAGALRSLIDRASEAGLLVISIFEDPVPAWADELMRRVDPDGIARRTLGPLSPHEVVALATSYSGVTPVDLPLSELMEDTGGVPELLHAYVIDWAVGDASFRLTRSADRASAERSNLRVAEADLAATVAEIELARERARVHGIEAVRSGEGSHRSAPVCPFKGLATFDPADADFFFGREQLISELVARSVGAPLLGVVGPSGSGKSSAVRAGLMPALAGGALPGSEAWPQTLMRPGVHPMEEMDRIADRSGHSLLVVDQFEETFTACSDEHERAAFVDAITTGGQDRIVVAAIRADFYGRCADFPALARLVGATHVLVGPMAETELRRAIELPARRAGLRVEPALVDALIAEVADRPGALPLLSTTLLELWQLRDGRTLTLQSYLETGGVSAAVARLAEDAYARLSPQQQIVARAMFLRLAGTQTGDAVVRRRVPLTELDVERDPDVAEVLTVLADARMVTVSEGSVEVAHEALLREWPRLRGWLEEDVQGRQLHHHLIEAAREWSEGGEDPADLYRGARLASAMDWTALHTFELNEQERNFLEHSREATVAETERAHRMNRRLKGSLAAVAVFLVIALIGASLALQQRGHARAQTTIAQSKRLAAEAVAETDVHRSVDLALAGLALDDSVDTRGALLHVLQRSPSAIGAIPTRGDVVDVAVDAGGRAVSLGDDGSVALFDPASHEMLGDPVPALDHAFPYQMSIDPAGTLVAIAGTIGQDTNVLFVDLAQRAVVARARFGRETEIMSMDFSPTGDRLAIALVDLFDVDFQHPTAGRKVVFVDPKNGHQRWEPSIGRFDPAKEQRAGDPRYSTSLTYLPDGDLAVSWLGGGTKIWRTDPWERVDAFGPGGSAIASDASGSTLAIAQSNGDVALLDPRTGRSRMLVGDRRSGPAFDLVVQADGGKVIASSPDRGIEIWDVATGRKEQLAGSGGLELSVDGGTLYSSGSDAAIQVWDLDGTRSLASTADVGATSSRVAVEPGGSAITYVPSRGASIGMWDEASGATSSVPGLPGQTCYGSISPSGTRLLETCDGGAGSDHETARNVALWDLTTGERIGNVLTNTDGPTWNGTFSPDGTAFATLGDDFFTSEGATAQHSIVTIRDIASMRIVHQLGLSSGSPPGTDGISDHVVYSPDGRFIAASTADDVRVWDAGSGLLIASPQLDRSPASDLAFSPDGRILALALDSGVVRLIDTTTWTDAEAPIPAPADSIAFTSDGGTLATASGGQVSLWDVETGRHLGGSFAGPTTDFGTVRALPDGRLVLMTANEPAALFRADPVSWKAQACAIVGDVSPGEWSAIAPDQAYRSPCGS